MADSDDEFDRRNAREKFRPERNDYERRDERRPRDAWEDREWAAGRGNDKRDVRRFSPPPHEGSPPRMKRMRRDWDDGVFPHYDVPFGALPAPPVAVPPSHPPGWASGNDVQSSNFSGASGNSRNQTNDNDPQTQPPMLTFKQFMNSQDDNISDVEAVKKFGDYKTDFHKSQINEFFVQHKQEEWFRMKYHPEEYDKRVEEARARLLTRCRVFVRLMEMNRISQVTVDIDQSENLVKLLDSAVILAEGGTEFDLKVLDSDGDVDNASGTTSVVPNRVDVKDTIKRERTSSASSGDEGKKTPPRFTEPLKLEPGIDTSADVPAPAVPEVEPTVVVVKKEKKQRRKTDGSGDESETGSLSDDTDDDAAKNKPNGIESTSISKVQGVDAIPSAGKADDAPGKDEDDGLEEGEERDEPKPRALHRTLSIFLRNLPLAVTKQEVEEVCKRYPGFIRVFLQDPQPERRFLRRAWVTFDHTVSVKEICWNLNSIRMRDCEIGAIVNRELKQRIRPVNGITVHRSVAKLDIRHAARVIHVLDSRWNIWSSPEDEKKDSEKEALEFGIENPILKGIAEYLVDEGNDEEHTVLGAQDNEEASKDTPAEVAIERDNNLLQALDKLVLYLRIVYSLDYYSAIEYPNEDEMPHRCGIMHARGPLPTGRVTQSEVNDWITSFEHRILPFISTKTSLTDSEMVRLGRKQCMEYCVITEVDKFILANTQELSKDKWLCPLSGKKFKGPDFVRKHILTKHLEKVEEVKNEVSYFNNFLKDPRRPQLPEHPHSKPSGSSGSQPLPAPAAVARDAYLPPTVGSFHGPLPPPPPAIGYRPPVMYQSGHHSSFRGGPDPFRGGGDFRRDRFPQRRDNSGPRGEPRRAAANYQDLDAPPDIN